MRPLLPLILLLVSPAAAHGATVGVEGTELVYRSAAGQEDLFEAEQEGNVLAFAAQDEGDLDLTTGPGCTPRRQEVRCSLAGLTGVRVLAGDSDDLVAFYGVKLPLVVDLGPGSDDFDASAPSLTLTAGDGSDRVGFAGGGGAIDMGPGEDHAQVTIRKAFAGPLTVEGGDGRDLLFADGQSRAGVTLSGGADGDELRVATIGTRTGLDIACGPGDDQTFIRLIDRPGKGCAPQLALKDPRTVSRAFRATLTAPARGSAELRRNPYPAQRGAVLLARGAFDAPAGAVRARLKTTEAGKRWIRRDPGLRLFVTVKLRAGGERSEIFFPSRLR